MSQQERKYLHIKSRTDTKEEWYNINPKLLEREIGYEKDTGQYKIGNGETLWRDLPYAHNIENGEGQFSLQQLSSQAKGNYSHAEGDGTIANGDAQHVQGKFNIEDTEEKYAHIVGNGENETKRSNAHTLDWEGNAWFANNILSQAPDSNLNCALSTPMYVGNFHMDWNASDILNNVWPTINLSLYDQYSEAVIEKTGTVGEIFNPNLFNITVGWDDNTINQHFESIAEAGIQILSDGQIYIFNKEVEDVGFWEQTLGVNITIYYTGGGAINVSNE